MLLSLICFILVTIFVIHYGALLFQAKIPFLGKMDAIIAPHFEMISFAACLLGLLGGLLTPFLSYSLKGILTGLLANAGLVALSMPYAAEKVLRLAGDRVNSAVAEAVHEMSRSVSARKDILFYVAVVMDLILIFGVV